MSDSRQGEETPRVHFPVSVKQLEAAEELERAKAEERDRKRDEATQAAFDRLIRKGLPDEGEPTKVYVRELGGRFKWTATRGPLAMFRGDFGSWEEAMADARQYYPEIHEFLRADW